MESTDSILSGRSVRQRPGLRHSSGSKAAHLLCAALAACLLLSAGLGIAAEPAVAAPLVLASITSLPSIVYTGEPFNVSLRLVSQSASVLQLRVAAEFAGQSVSWALSLAPGESAEIVLPLKAPAAEMKSPCRICVTEAASAQIALWEEPFILREIRGDFSDLVAADNDGLANRSGVRVMLLNKIEDDATYRRWAPVRWASGLWRHHGLPHTVWASARLLGAARPDATRVGNDATEARIPGTSPSLIAYRGDPLQAVLEVPKSNPSSSDSVLCFLWGYEEAAAHLPVRELERALDAAIDRVRAGNPGILVVLATPPPLPGAERFTASYSVAIRRLARVHHVPLIDLHAKVLSQKDWHSLYALDGDASTLGFYPSQEGCRRLAAWLEEGMP